MTPARILVVILALILGATLAVGSFGQPPPAPRLSDDDYISIALSQPEVFRPTGPGSGRNVSARVVERRSDVVVEVISDGIRFRVHIDPRTNTVEQVIRQ